MPHVGIEALLCNYERIWFAELDPSLENKDIEKLWHEFFGKNGRELSVRRDKLVDTRDHMKDVVAEQLRGPTRECFKEEFYWKPSGNQNPGAFVWNTLDETTQKTHLQQFCCYQAGKYKNLWKRKHMLKSHLKKAGSLPSPELITKCPVTGVKKTIMKSCKPRDIKVDTFDRICTPLEEEIDKVTVARHGRKFSERRLPAAAKQVKAIVKKHADRVKKEDRHARREFKRRRQIEKGMNSDANWRVMDEERHCDDFESDDERDARTAAGDLQMRPIPDEMACVTLVQIEGALKKLDVPIGMSALDVCDFVEKNPKTASWSKAVPVLAEMGVHIPSAGSGLNGQWKQGSYVHRRYRQLRGLDDIARVARCRPKRDPSGEAHIPAPSSDWVKREVKKTDIYKEGASYASDVTVTKKKLWMDGVAAADGKVQKTGQFHDVTTKRDKVVVDLLKKCNEKLEKLIKDGIFFTLLTAVTVYWYIWDDDSQAGGGKEKLILLSLLPLAHVFKCTNKAHFSALGETVMWCSGASAHTGSAVDCAMQWARDRIEGVLQFLNSRTSPSVLSNGV